ncbi:MAG: acyl-CoA dehydrogenase [Gemmatimonadetes bacterium]|nr:acyl-CoA dehydrogenase [Gemmatimonadota bacterium]MYG36315.1 acyl-CoA dehydrogenase [Gemmatimonadota bacterium]
MTTTRNPQAHRARTRTDIVAPWPSQAMLGLLDRDPRTLAEGDPLPLGWHWLHFMEPVRASSLAPDGHEERGEFMPAVDLPRRMWAGGELRAIRPVVIGEPARLKSEVLRVTEKVGKSGRLVFVSVGQTVVQAGRPCVEEEQVIVYREAERLPAAATARPEPPERPEAPVADWTETFLPTPVTLFQFSALTYNGHRIHYDQPYVTGREGYAGLLVHGPLTALLLLDAAGRHSADPVSRFRYRALAPLYVDEPITLVGSGRTVEALGPAGSVAMRGRVG